MCKKSRLIYKPRVNLLFSSCLKLIFISIDSNVGITCSCNILHVHVLHTASMLARTHIENHEWNEWLIIVTDVGWLTIGMMILATICVANNVLLYRLTHSFYSVSRFWKPRFFMFAPEQCTRYKGWWVFHVNAYKWWWWTFMSRQRWLKNGDYYVFIHSCNG